MNERPDATDDQDRDLVVDDDATVDALIVDIAETRTEMAGTVDELGNRLAPAAVADRAGEAVRQATVGRIETKVNDMTNSAADMVSTAGQTAQEAGTGLIETIRRNPLPAAMAGIGIGWLLINRSQGGASTRTWSSGRRPLRTSWAAGDDGWRRTHSVGSDGSSFGDRASDLSNRAGEMTDDARSAIGDTMDDLGDRASHTADSIGMSAGDAMAGAQRTIESNPLAFGAVAVAVGTAIGLALPATETEKRTIGQTGRRLIDQAETAVSQPLDDMARDSGAKGSGSGSSS